MEFAMRLFALPLLLITTPTLAQAPAAMMACVPIPTDSERLACFDKAMANTSAEARAASEKRAAEAAVLAAAAAKAAAEAEAAASKARAEAEAVAQRESFGAEGVAGKPNRYAPPAGEIQEIETAVAELYTNASGQTLFLLEDGHLWKQVDTSRVPNVRPGDRIKITRAGLGGYHLNFAKQKTWVLVKRVR
jgi:hypothetical protein